MRNLSIASTLVVLAPVAMCGSMAYATEPPSVLWQDNFTGQATGTRLCDIGWSVIGTTNLLTSYVIENAYSPPVSVRTYGMGQNAVFTLQQTVTGMDSRTSQWFHFLVHQAYGTSQALLDECRVTTSGGCIFVFLIAEAQVQAQTEGPGGTYNSGNLGNKLSDNAWHDFDIKYNNAAGSQTISFYINNGSPVWSQSVSSPGYITRVQFVEQGGVKTGSESSLIGQMRVGTADACTPPAAPTGIAASPATICSAATSTLSVNNPGAGLTTDWFSGSCGGPPVAGGAGVNSVSVSPTATTTYYARTRRTADGCTSLTCASVTVTIPNCDDGNVCTTDTCSNGVCSHTNNTNACEDDGNPCTNDVCSNGVCTHPNNTNACDDGNACTTNDTCQAGACVGSPTSGNACDDGNACTRDDICQSGTCAGTPVVPCDTSNGFNADWILVLRGGTYESEIRKLSKAEPNVSCSDLGPFGTQADQTWPHAVAALQYSWAVCKDSNCDGTGTPLDPWIWYHNTLDTSSIKSLCFSNSPVAGANSPAGARLFGVYEVRNMSDVALVNQVTPPGPNPAPSYEVNALNAPDGVQQQETYSSSSFQIVEFNSAGKRIRVMEVGLAANLYDGVHRGINDPNGPNTDRNILTDPHWGDNEEGWVGTRTNTGGVRIGNIRYNKAKDTICVACIVREHGTSDANLPPVGRVYEFALPDWPEQYYPADHPVVEWRNQPIPIADPNQVKLVQIYELPCSCVVNGVRTDGVTPYQCRVVMQGTWEGHSVSKNNGQPFENEHQRPVVAFDDNGTMYVTSIFCAATGIYFDQTKGAWTGEVLDHGDIIKCSTIGHWAGKDVYTIPIYGDDACNIAISAHIEDPLLAPEYPQLPPSLYASGVGLAVRGSLMNQLLEVPQVECNDAIGGDPWFEYINIFNTTATRTDYPCELQRIESVHHAIPFSGCNWTDGTKTLSCAPGAGLFAGFTMGNSNLVFFSAGSGVVGINATQYTIAAKLSNDAIQLTTDINGAGGNITNGSIAGEINLSRAELPRKPLYAQYDPVGQRTYLGNEMGACGGAQNFMSITDDDTVRTDVGYFLGYWKEHSYSPDPCPGKTPFYNPDGTQPGQLNHTWDAAASPPVPPDDPMGACCLPGSQTCQVLHQTACAAQNGFWQGANTVCGQFACSWEGACCRACGKPCELTRESDCTGFGSVWKGGLTSCDSVACETCSPQPMDIDCDGDVDQLDFAAFEECFDPAASAVPAKCQCFDKAPDSASANKIDTYDYGIFEACASGPGIVLGNVDCATPVP